MNPNHPPTIDGARVLQSTAIDARHRFTGNCRHTINGAPAGPVSGLAICQYDDTDEFYLFGCDESWNRITDTLHDSIAEAVKQAEFEYEGTKDSWIPIPNPAG